MQSNLQGWQMSQNLLFQPKIGSSRAELVIDHHHPSNFSTQSSIKLPHSNYKLEGSFFKTHRKDSCITTEDLILLMCKHSNMLLSQNLSKIIQSSSFFPLRHIWMTKTIYISGYMQSNLQRWQMRPNSHCSVKMEQQNLLLISAIHQTSTRKHPSNVEAHTKNTTHTIIPMYHDCYNIYDYFLNCRVLDLGTAK